jgi:nitrogen fixation NifU-like protein
MKSEDTFSQDDADIYPAELITMAHNPHYFGRMNDPTSSAYMNGPCGDEMEFYLVIDSDVIDDIRFYTTGCIATIVCGTMTAQFAIGKTTYDALSISAKQVIDTLKGLPEQKRHCAILAVSALYNAIADYLLKL